MSRVSRTYFPSGFIATLAERTANDNVRSQDTNIVIGHDAAKSMTSSALNNIVIGNDSAPALENGRGNIYIGDEMGNTSNESNKLRIGNRGIQSSDLIVGTMSSTLASQNLVINGFVNVSDDSDASSATDATASIHTDGGVSVTKSLWVGTSLDVTGPASFDSSVTLGNSSGDSIVARGAFTPAQGIRVGSANVGAIYNANYDTNSVNASNISVSTFQTNIETNGSETRTLPNGTITGQLKRIVMSVDGGGNCIVTITSPTGSSTITFSDVGQFVELLWDSNSWTIIGIGGGDTGTFVFPSVSGSEEV